MPRFRRVRTTPYLAPTATFGDSLAKMISKREIPGHGSYGQTKAGRTGGSYIPGSSRAVANINNDRSVRNRNEATARQAGRTSQRIAEGYVHVITVPTGSLIELPTRDGVRLVEAPTNFTILTPRVDHKPMILSTREKR